MKPTKVNLTTVLTLLALLATIGAGVIGCGHPDMMPTPEVESTVQVEVMPGGAEPLPMTLEPPTNIPSPTQTSQAEVLPVPPTLIPEVESTAQIEVWPGDAEPLPMTLVPPTNIPTPTETRQAEVPPVPPTPTATPESYLSPLVAIFAQNFTYNSVQEEIEQYKKDIEKDLSARVIIFAQDFGTPQEIRSKLLELRNQGLIGAVLVGDIPTTYLKATLNEPDLTTVPTDFYYMDLDDDFTIREDRFFEYSAEPTSLLPEIWIGRLKPPVSGEEGISLLRRYFRRNHAYRTGEIKSSKRMLIFDAISAEEVSGTERDRYLENVNRLVERAGLYQLSEVAIVSNANATPGFQEYSSKLREDFELVYLNLHGTPTTQQIGSLYISAEDIKQIQPNPRFYFIWSCSNGNFTEENYMAGSYLFYGDGLVVLASTVPVFGNIESGESNLFPLSLGATWGEAYKYANYLSSMTLLGDPTLRMREKPELTPKLVLEQKEIDFGEVPVVDMNSGELLTTPPNIGEVRIEVRNEGEMLLKISPVPSYGHYLRDGRAPEGMEASPISFGFPGQVQPGTSEEITLTFLPSKPGNYIGFEAFYTNDPDNILVVIPFRGRGIATQP